MKILARKAFLLFVYKAKRNKTLNLCLKKEELIKGVIFMTIYGLVMKMFLIEN